MLGWEQGSYFLCGIVFTFETLIHISHLLNNETMIFYFTYEEKVSIIFRKWLRSIISFAIVLLQRNNAYQINIRLT